jgi:beta-N-acetylhexosaminidase
VRFRPLRLPADRDAVAALWREALAPTWPFLPDGLDRVPAGHVAEDGNRVVGMVGVDPAGSIPFVAVATANRRRGVGTELVRRALAEVDSGTVGVGSGGDTYIWPGIPTDLPEARPFFKSLGWTEDHVASDLVQDLSAPGLDDRLAALGTPTGLDMVQAGQDELGAVRAFEAAHFPQWSRQFQKPREAPLVARDRTGEIAGTLLLAGPGRVSIYWPTLGEDCGTIGCVGVHPDRHGAGIGTAMVAHATRLLADRGVRQCLIDWAVRLDFYGRLGYRVWRRYAMGRLPKPEPNPS